MPTSSSPCSSPPRSRCTTGWSRGFAPGPRRARTSTGLAPSEIAEARVQRPARHVRSELDLVNADRRGGAAGEARPDEAAAVIEALGMRAHPEGGWYAETWRAAAGDGRPRGSAIVYLLAAGERSHWHRVDADEVWQYSAGGPLELRVWADGDEAITVHRLGGDIGWLGGPGGRAGGCVAGRASARCLDARRVHRDAGLRVRRFRARASRLGATGGARRDE